MNLGTKQVVTDPALALRNEQGTFLVWGPSGQVDRYVCHPGASIASITYLETREPRNNYQIEKFAEETQLTEKSKGAHA